MYKPLFEITSKIIELISNISEKLEKLIIFKITPIICNCEKKTELKLFILRLLLKTTV